MTTSNFNNTIEFFKSHNYAQESDNLAYITEFYKHFGFFLEKALDGQYRLMFKDEYDNEHYVTEDPACEDTYDEDCAAVVFFEAAIQYIIDNPKEEEED